MQRTGHGARPKAGRRDISGKCRLENIYEARYLCLKLAICLTWRCLKDDGFLGLEQSGKFEDLFLEVSNE